MQCFVAWQWHHSACFCWHTFLTHTFWSLRVTHHDLSLLAFVLWLAWDIIEYVVSRKSATNSFDVSIGVENALLVLDWTQSLASVTCFSQQGQDVRMNHFFCVNAFLCCSSVSSPMPAIYWCRAIRRHVLRLSDCPTSFTLLFFNVAVASDGSRKYAVGYSLFCSCC